MTVAAGEDRAPATSAPAAFSFIAGSVTQKGCPGSVSELTSVGVSSGRSFAGPGISCSVFKPAVCVGWVIAEKLRASRNRSREHRVSCKASFMGMIGGYRPSVVFSYYRSHCHYVLGLEALGGDLHMI